jgi:hypothetical protein
LRGSGARRVHNTTLSSFGFPEATPNVKGLLALVLMQLLLTVASNSNPTLLMSVQGDNVVGLLDALYEMAGKSGHQ